MDNDKLLVAIKDMFEISFTEFEKRINENMEETLGRMLAMFEALRSDVKALADGQSLLSDKLDRIIQVQKE